MLDNSLTQFTDNCNFQDDPHGIPAEPEIELAFLASIIQNTSYFYEYAESVSQDDFYLSVHKRLWARLQAAVLDGVSDLSDPMAVCGDDAEAKMALLDAASSYYPSNIDTYYKRLKFLTGKRRWLSIIEDVAEMSMNGQKPSDIADYLQAAVTEYQRTDTENPFGRLEAEIVSGAALAEMEIGEREYVVEDVLRTGSLSIFFGAPGDFKSMILMDLALCVARGVQWLQPLPVDGNTQEALATKKRRTLWVNYDQGTDDVTERFQALQKTYGVTGNLDILSHPLIMFAPTTATEARKAGDWLQSRKYGLVVIDSLLDVRGAADLKEAEMGDVLRLWRIVAELSGAAIVLISHSTKETKDLYGSQFIKAKLDHAYHITRSGDVATVTATKQRSHGLNKIKARWCSQWKPGTRTLESCKFMGDETATEHHPNNTTQEECQTVLMSRPGQSLTIDEVLVDVNARRAGRGDDGLTRGAIKVALTRLEAHERNIGRLADPVRYNFGALSDANG